jgi:2,3-diketo-5-methylthio-1-phosphopentane phosphatase
MIEIFCDFDGTLTDRDTLWVLLDRFAPPEWYDIELKMLAGEMSERDGLKAELKMINQPDEILLSTLLKEIKPAQGIEELVALVRQEDWKMQVLSGGLLRFAGALWRQWGYGDIPLYANDHYRNGEGGIEVIEANIPRLKEHCNHCKRWHLEEALKRGSEVIYIGDGLTDFCPAEVAHRRYAKGHLLEHLQKKGLEAIPFDDLRVVAEDLKHLTAKGAIRRGGSQRAQRNL